MANTTVRGAVAIHGQNPQYLVESVIRNRIYDSNYWKEHCFALTAETIIDKAIELKAIGGVYGNQKPTEFLCLLLKMLQIQPEKEILLEYLQADEFKYLRALAAFYIRMTFRPVDVYEILEPLLKDYRKIRYRGMGGYSLTYMDEFVDQLLTEERVCDLILPRLTKRDVLEDLGELGPRKSRLLDAMEGKSEHGSEKSRSRSRSSDRTRSRSGSPRSIGSAKSRSSARSPSRGRSAGSKSPRSPSPTGSRYISRSRSGSRSPYRSRSRSISPDRVNGSAGGSRERFRSRSRSISPDRMDTT
ncbi:PRP38 family-domain-containing protein, partial [Earliella scabrosa]